MAGLGNIELRIDPFFVETRVEICTNRGCIFNDSETTGCKLKKIAIALDGACRDFEKKKEGVKV